MRITTDNKVSEMGMWELAHNSCYVGENGSARYRDYSSDVDCREMIKKMMVNFGVVESDYWDDAPNEVFDDEMMENLIYGMNNMRGLIALFYRNLWAMADLREKLKQYEDLEEQGLLVKLPCKVGDIVYQITRDFISEYQIRNFKCYDNGNIFIDWKCIKGIYKNVMGFHIDDIGKKVFLTKEAAEEELKRLESAE